MCKSLLNDYFSRSLIEGEMKRMKQERAQLNNGKISARSLIEHCVKNRHFPFLHLKKEEKDAYINNIVDRLIAANVLYRNYKEDFECLYATVEKAIGDVKGVGRLMLYDVSRMIGYALQPVILPKAMVYLHQGAKEGAKRLLKVIRIGHRLPVDRFKEFFPGVESQYIEDILCIYKDCFEDCLENCFKNGKFRPKSTCCPKVPKPGKGCCIKSDIII